MRYASGALGFRTKKCVYNFKNVQDFVWYADEGNDRLMSVKYEIDHKIEVDFYEADSREELSTWWQMLKEAHRPYKNHKAATGLQRTTSEEKSHSDLLGGLHSISTEKWEDLGYLGKRADWLMSFRTRMFRVDLTEGILEYYHPDDDMDRLRKRGRRRWWVKGHRLLLLDRKKFELEIHCGTSNVIKESDHKLIVRARDQPQFVRVVKLLHKAGAVPHDALLPDIMSSNRMNAIYKARAQEKSGECVVHITKQFDEFTSRKITRYLDMKIGTVSHDRHGVRCDVSRAHSHTRTSRRPVSEQTNTVREKIRRDTMCETHGAESQIRQLRRGRDESHQQRNVQR